MYTVLIADYEKIERNGIRQLLKNETKEIRKTLDEILKDIVKEWDGYEQIFENG